jgi:hypothetical protein
MVLILILILILVLVLVIAYFRHNYRRRYRRRYRRCCRRCCRQPQISQDMLKVFNYALCWGTSTKHSPQVGISSSYLQRAIFAIQKLDL